jgi:hypothetical protein
MRVLAVPNAHYPPAADALALADAVVVVPADLTVEAIRRVDGPETEVDTGLEG